MTALGGLAWPEVADRLAGGATVVLPCGATEQHGPHLPLDVDTRHAAELASRLAQRHANCLAAPVVPIGVSSHHMPFAGTLSISEPTFLQVVRETVGSLRAHGAERICVFSAHIGNFAALAKYSAELSEQEKEKVTVFSDRDAFIGVWQETVARRTGTADNVGAHADVAETSIMLALAPEAVRTAELPVHGTGRLRAEDYAHIFADGIASVSETGVLGDTRGADAALGEELITNVLDLLDAFFFGSAGVAR
ncbi:creatinine amidohydrolase [Pseudonocardia thermophila]|uniref:Creatinine amidohydrolase n=1 Tax=Pseudonocardia thermophila TaxID=1848 RepID=A0A1M6N3M8_PSETH|nr:creatininase family protein [Pseudonocardia thermophila]SHJ90319.1 creatinine amidohydrolase [Pseudonocardia thermophila]